MEESTRQKKVSGLILQELSSIFFRDMRDYFGDNMATISLVRVTRDLSLAKVYVRFIKSENLEELMKIINTLAPKIRYKLSASLKNHLKKMPELRFYLDDTSDYVEHMNELIEKINPENE